MNTPDSSLPSPQQVKDHLEQHAYVGPSRSAAWIGMGGLGFAVVLSLMARDAITMSLAWLILLAVLIWSMVRSARQRQLEAQAQAVQEMVMLRQFPQALRLAWRLVPRLVGAGDMHGRMVALMAMSLDQLQAYEASLVALDQLIARLPENNPISLQLRLQRVMVQLATDHLLDADQSLRRLRSQVNEQTPSTQTALLHTATLYQCVRTHHDQEAADMFPQLLDRLQPMGVEAGYGYALAAVAARRLMDRQPEQSDHWRKQVELWWSRATLLVDPQVLVGRFPEASLLIQEPQWQSVTMNPRNPRPRNSSRNSHSIYPPNQSSSSAGLDGEVIA